MAPMNRSADPSAYTPPEKQDLPTGWEWTTLGEVGMVTAGGTPSAADSTNFGGEIAWITPADLTGYEAKFIGQGRRNLSQKGYDSSSATLLEPGTVLFSSRAPIGYVAIAANEISTNQGFKNLTPFPGVSSDYVYHYLKSAKKLAESYASGTTFLELSAAKFASLPFPLPPFPEQQRIVAKIEELFSKLDAGIAELGRTQTLLRRYRQSLLHAAVTGELSREWREGNPATETGAALLERILRERREKWAQDGKKGKYKEPQGPDVEGLPELPEGWAWASIGQLLSVPIINGLSIRGSDTPPGVLALRLNAMSDSGFDFDQVRYLPLQESDVDDLFIEEGDFFVSRGNGSLKLVGRGTLAQHPPGRIIFPDTMMRLRVGGGMVAWVKTIWPGYSIRAQIEREAKTTAGIWKISQPQLAAVTLPLPPPAEQAFIVSEVERRLSVLDNLEATVSAELKRAEATRQSVLHQAFTGRLVPQDAQDEPARVLLERIRAQRAAAGGKPGRGAGQRGRPRRARDDGDAGIPQADSVEEASEGLEARKRAQETQAERAEATRLVELFSKEG